MSQICVQSNHFYTALSLGFIAIGYSIYKQSLIGSMPTPIQREPIIVNIKETPTVPPEMTPPLRKGPFTYRDGIGVPINTPTRGEYGAFGAVGFISDPADKEKTMQLVGRRIHSNQYEYYTYHHYNPSIKLPLKVPGNKELNDGDKITVPGYEGEFDVKIYDLDYPRYMP